MFTETVVHSRSTCVYHHATTKSTIASHIYISLTDARVCVCVCVCENIYALPFSHVCAHCVLCLLHDISSHVSLLTKPGSTKSITVATSNSYLKVSLLRTRSCSSSGHSFTPTTSCKLSD